MIEVISERCSSACKRFVLACDPLSNDSIDGLLNDEHNGGATGFCISTELALQANHRVVSFCETFEKKMFFQKCSLKEFDKMSTRFRALAHFNCIFLDDSIEDLDIVTAICDGHGSNIVVSTTGRNFIGTPPDVRVKALAQQLERIQVKSSSLASRLFIDAFSVSMWDCQGAHVHLLSVLDLLQEQAPSFKILVVRNNFLQGSGGGAGRQLLNRATLEVMNELEVDAMIADASTNFTEDFDAKDLMLAKRVVLARDSEALNELRLKYNNLKEFASPGLDLVEAERNSLDHILG